MIIQSVREPIKCGYTVYLYEYNRIAYRLCRWYLYPFYRMIVLIKLGKWRFYAWLNRKGIMHTPLNRVMQLTDIPIIKKLQEYSLKVEHRSPKSRI